MSPKRTILDLSRLFSRRGRAAPTGIDRVELAEARRLLGGEALFLVTRGRKSRFLPAAEAEALTAHLERRWAAGTEEGRRSMQTVCAFLGAPTPKTSGLPPDAPPPRVSRRLLPLPARPRRPEGQLTYRNVSHHHLEKDGYLRWLKEDWRARVEVYWHDAIPILFPEYARPGDAEKHERRLRQTLRWADAVEVNSAATAKELRGLAERFSLPMPPVMVAALTPSLPRAEPLSAERSYFVTVGTIEPRKNHRMLLEVWRRLARQHGGGTPALVIAGRRGWMNEDTFALLDRSPPLQAHVIEAPDLADRSLAALIGGAKALLMPSFAEGFGLPVAEAQMLGTKVIASDLAVFREVSQGEAEFIPPEAGGRWLDRIAELSGLGGL